MTYEVTTILQVQATNATEAQQKVQENNRKFNPIIEKAENIDCICEGDLCTCE